MIMAVNYSCQSTNHVLDEETRSTLEDSLDEMLFKANMEKMEDEPDLQNIASESQIKTNRKDSRVKPETMLSRVSAFAGVSDEIVIEDLFEYMWPVDEQNKSLSDSSEKKYYVVQELLADFLKIKSFKRRYPELLRRSMDAYERSWLQNAGLVSAGRSELGLTAILSDEVMCLLQNDFPDVHITLGDLFRQKRFQKLADKQKKQYEAARIERGEAKAEAARKRAIDSAFDFNRQFVSERQRDRRCYWDLQTMQIHIPKPDYRYVPEDVALKITTQKGGAYPVAVIPGQFTENFVAFTPTELTYLPLSKALYTLPNSKARPIPPLPAFLRYGSFRTHYSVDEIDSSTKVPFSSPMTHNSMQNEPKPTILSNSNDINFLTNGQYTHGISSSEVPQHTTVNGSENSQSAQLPVCSVCGQPMSNPLRCSECNRLGHPRCLELPDSMIEIVKTYAWSCMDCKRCIECQDTGNEDKMMFCDLCDRGYHVFCVGLSQIPEGNWECPTCDQNNANNTNISFPKNQSPAIKSVSMATPVRRSSSRSSMDSHRRRKTTNRKSLLRRSAKRFKPENYELRNLEENSCSTQPEIDADLFSSPLTTFEENSNNSMDAVSSPVSTNNLKSPENKSTLASDHSTILTLNKIDNSV